MYRRISPSMHGYAWLGRVPKRLDLLKLSKLNTPLQLDQGWSAGTQIITCIHGKFRVSHVPLRNILTPLLKKSLLPRIEVIPTTFWPTKMSQNPAPSESAGPSSTPLPSTAVGSQRSARFEWTTQAEVRLLTELISASQKGHRSQNGFKPRVWNELETKLKPLDQSIEPRKLKNKYGDFLRKWRAWKALMDNSGFGFDEGTQLITASNDVWNRYIEVSRHRDKYPHY